ncbi:MAG: hypothetical protein ACFFKA_14875 [Candidatus Thorarchaeota archaeon]
MVLVVATIIFPFAKSREVAKRNVELMQKYPPELSVGKILIIGVRATVDGMKVLAVGEAKKGKVEEFMTRLVRLYQEYTNLEGYRYEIETYFDIAEAYKVLGMEVPSRD